MGNSCTVKVYCKNPKGEVVESKLFKDLLHYTSNNRPLANTYYGIGTNEEFLERNREAASFDENGEITFNALKKLTGIKVSDDSLLKTLNEDIKAGIGTYEEVMPKLQRFNSSSQFKDDYLATIESTKDGRYKLSVVKRTPKSEKALYKEIAGANLIDRLIFYLNERKVNVAFLQDNTSANGRYSTINATKTSDGLYELIKVAHGENMEAALAEEAGHFAVGSLGNDPLVTRLLDLLTPEIQKEVLGDSYYGKMMGTNPRREVAGVLVGRALMKGKTNNSIIDKLLNRIVNKVKRIFYRLSGQEVKAIRLQAEYIAEEIANGFMSPDFKGTVEEALNTQETLYEEIASSAVESYNKTVEELKSLVDELSAIDKEFAKQLRPLLQAIDKKKTDINGTRAAVLRDNFAISGVIQSAIEISKMLEIDVPQLLDQTDTEYKYTYLSDLPKNANNLMRVKTILIRAQNIAKLAEGLSGIDSIASDPESRIEIETLSGDKESFLLEEVSSKLTTAISLASNKLIPKEQALFLGFLRKTLGKNYVDRATRVVFNFNESKKKKRFNGFVFSQEAKLSEILKVKPGEKVEIDAVLGTLNTDINSYEEWLASAANSPDLIMQIVDKATKQRNKLADDKTNEYWDRLRVLQAKLAEIGITDTDIFYERSLIINKESGKGQFTGNIVSPLCWGDYENDWLEFRKEQTEIFLKEYPNLESLSDTAKAIAWDEFFKPKAKIWHNGSNTTDENGNPQLAHSKWNTVKKMYEPAQGGTNKKSGSLSIDYRNSQYDELSDEAKEWLSEYMKIKEELDKFLPVGSTMPNRAPQFKGSFTNKLKNRRISETKLNSFGKTLRNNVRDTFCEDFDDVELGSNQTANSIDDALFGDNYVDRVEVEKDKANRIPLFGINKLKDSSQLSTDLFRSTLAYASMACSYKAMSEVRGILEVGKSVLENREVEGKKETDANRGHSKAYTRYIKFLDRQVYSLGPKKIMLGDKIVLNKLANFINSLGSTFYLWGNYISAAVNFGTGFFEITKEALTGEHFDLEDYYRALKIYGSSLIFSNMSNDTSLWGTKTPFFKRITTFKDSNLGKSGKVLKDDKLSMLVRRFNIVGDNRQQYRNWATREGRGVHSLKSIGWAPYRMGDNFMQTISYIAIMSKTKIVNQEGEEVGLEEAYNYDTIVDDNGVTKDAYGKTLTIKNSDKERYFLTEERRLDFIKVENLLSKISSTLDAGNEVTLTSEEKELLDKYDITTDANNYIEVIEKRLQDLIETLPYNSIDESSIMDKAREINNRMHGIYNSQDKVAANQKIWSAMLLSMKGYALGMIERRFGASKYNVALGHEVEGNLVSAGKFTYDMLRNKNFKVLSQAIFLPFSKNVEAEMRKLNYSENQYYNVKRTAFDSYFIAILYILQLLASVGADDGDDTEEFIYGNVNYFFYRWYMEQAAFNTFGGLKAEKANLANVAEPIGTAAVNDILELGLGFCLYPINEMTDDFFGLYYDKDSGYGEEGDFKPWIHLQKSTPFIKSLITITHPKEAMEGYKFARDTK